MKLLFWTPPWASQGNPMFFRNCTEKFLIPQANMLAEHGHQVDFVLPAALGSLSPLLSGKVRKIDLPLDLYRVHEDCEEEVYTELYRGKNTDLVLRIAELLKPALGQGYDAVLLWENPVPFLQYLFPHTVVLHQMPGTFTRAPYPETVTIDPQGLYRQGLLFTDAAAIQAPAIGERGLRSVGQRFGAAVRTHLSAGSNPAVPEILNAANEASSRALLPLQVSSHYAFSCDAGYRNQYDFLLDALDKSDPETSVVVTQYVHRLASEKVLSAELCDALRKAHPNLVFDEAFDGIDSVSQHLLPHVDQVWTASSSLGLQAMAWGHGLKVFGETFLAPYDQDVPSAVSWVERCEHTVGFLVSKYQPLASKVRRDADFMTRYIEALIAWKKDEDRSAETLSYLADVQPGTGYIDELLASFRPSGSSKADSRALKEFSEKLQSCNVVSFDIFDTLVRRPCEKPGDLYRFIQPHVSALTGGEIRNFAQIRSNCEHMARIANKGLEADEITLDQIYEIMGATYGYSDELLRVIKHLEVGIEVQVCSVRPFGQQLFNLAKSMGKSIVLTSDMYLSEPVIEAIVRTNGYDGYSSLFLSSTSGARKHTGILFEHLLDSMNLEPEELLHVGDNLTTDVAKPKEMGIETFHWPQAIDRMRQNGRYKEIYDPRNGAGKRSRSILAGLTAHRLFDRELGKDQKGTLFNGRAFNLGFSAVGPILLGYVKWIGDQAKARGISDLYFFSREGFILHEVYKALFGSDPDAPKSSYFYISRRCARVAALESVSEVIALASEPFSPNVSLAKLLTGRFGLPLQGDNVHAALETAGFASPEQVLKNDVETRGRFVHLARLLAEDILKNAEIERAAYLDYVRFTGLNDAHHPGVVDVGWKGNLQASLMKLTGKQVEGFYYATTTDAVTFARDGHVHHGYLGTEVNEARTPSAVLKNRHLFEYLTCHTDPTLINFGYSDGQAVPIFHLEAGRHTRAAFIAEVHAGALAFAHDYQREFGNLSSDVSFDPFLCEGAFKSFVESPAKADAELLRGKEFEDIVGGVERKGLSLQKPPASTSRPRVESKAAGTDGECRASNGGLDAPGRRRLEATIVALFASDRKRLKYGRNRRRFFEDSKSRIARAWYLNAGGA
ncbi:hypothetical protein [Salipiger sp. PrR003]|uniref:HAD family hydrolase n=1 Tax=Salipiger sp. PrR003 TaxID=2706776 RepID=UPI0013D9C6A5|nr:hypothetical protein [Salipiger sp. PrR003]NDV50407.1 hypothetical protein [Salipiger sp. PrR003]